MTVSGSTLQDSLNLLMERLGERGWQSATSSYADHHSQPLLILKPADVDELVDAIQICAQAGIPIIPQGGNTNVCRMTDVLPGQNPVLVSMVRMDRVIEVNPACATMTVEAGCIMQVAQHAAAEHGLLFAPDWGARGSAMVGGAVATNGGGLNVFRYGTTREQVLGMEVVLADGRVWNGLRALRKDASGYDLKQLFIGSEGTLGIITKIVFKLHTLPKYSQSMFAVLNDLTRITDYLATAKAIAGDCLVGFELLNGIGVEKALERYPDLHRPLDTRSDWYILIRLAGNEMMDELLESIFEAAQEQGLLDDAVMSQSLAQEQNLWELRDQMIPLQYFKGSQVKWDASVPIDRIVEFLQRAEAIAHQHQPEAVSYAIGHVGDGNIHYNIFPMGEDGPAMDKLVATYIEEIDALIWSLGGSVVAEHGVGSVFVTRMQKQKTPVEYELMKQLKSLIDPDGIMNPGKLLSE